MARFTRKTFIVSLVSALTFSLSATPALAHDHDSQLASAAASPQLLDTAVTTADVAPINLPNMLDTIALESGPQHGFDVEAAIAQATQEIGTSRATGWSQPGECIMSAQRWIRAGGGNWPENGGTPVTNYNNAVRIPLHLADAGDIIQYENSYAPHAWVSGVHTLLITGVNDDGTFSIIESNNPFGSGLVTANDNWTPDPPMGFQVAVWRF